MGWVREYRWKNNTPISLKSLWGNLASVKKVSSSHYSISNSNFQAKMMSDTVHCHQNILLWSCTISNWSRSRKFHKSLKQALSSGILSLCWHPCQVWISFHLKNDYTSHCCSTKVSSCCKAEHICPAKQPSRDLCSEKGWSHPAWAVGWGRLQSWDVSCAWLWAVLLYVPLFHLCELSETPQPVTKTGRSHVEGDGAKCCSQTAVLREGSIGSLELSQICE